MADGKEENVDSEQAATGTLQSLLRTDFFFLFPESI